MAQAFTEFRTTESVKVVKDHYLLQMEPDSLIKPALIKVMGGHVVQITSPMEIEVDTRVKDRWARDAVLLRYAGVESFPE